MSHQAKQGFKLFALTTIVLLIAACLVLVPNLLPPSNPAHRPIASTLPISQANSARHSATDLGAELEPRVLHFLNKYCLECHTGDDAEGDVALDQFKTIKQVLDDTETWTMVTEALDQRYMPPEDADQPNLRELSATKRWIKTVFANHGDHQKPERMIRRMNQQEYINTVQDLLKLPDNSFRDPSRIVINEYYFDPESGSMPKHVMAMNHYSYGQKLAAILSGITDLPTDPPVEHGFSNDQSQLSLSPLLLERFFEFASSVVNSPTFHRRSELWNTLFVPLLNSDSLDKQLLVGESRLLDFLERAFRRPVSESEFARYTTLLENEIRDGASYTEAMKTTVSAILTSPKFLYRLDITESNPESGTADDFALASRLSYFLWGTMPDEILMLAAREGRLNNETQVRNQVRRMMASPKIKSLSTDFGMQWLRISKVNSARPDIDLFPSFYRGDVPPPSVAMTIEQMLLFETILVEDRSILEFINADYGYLNLYLMKWYGLDPVELLGYEPEENNYEDYFKIKWPDARRGGIITSGAMLMSTSATNRTSPVYRGAWILDVVFNRPPPPAPANIPPLDITGAESEKPLNVREKLQIHRQDPACAVCHDRIDPLGFALERYDAVGKPRRKYQNGDEINSRGKIYGMPFNGAPQFKRVVLRNRAKFVRAFVEHMMKYALGRKIHASDQAEIERITQHVIDNEFRFSEVVQQITLSEAFRAGLPPFKHEPPPARFADQSGNSQTQGLK